MKRLVPITLCIALGSPVQAGIIDFETLPASMGGGSPTDNQLLTGAYVTEGVTLEFEVDDDQDGTWESPRFEKTGRQSFSDSWGYTSAAGRDTPLAGFGAQQGQWFIRHNNNSQGFPPTNLRVRYTSTSGPVTAASGEIWDIDRNEQWLVMAYDSVGSLLDEILSPMGTGGFNPLDGLPWTFGFTGLSDIREIQLRFVGTDATVGLAFNNFSPTTSVIDPPNPNPEPSTLFLLAAGVLGLTRRWRKGANEE